MARRRRRRLGALDLVLIALLALAAGWLAWRVHAVFVYRWDWSRIPGFILHYDEASGRWLPSLLGQGLLLTIRLSVWGGLLAGVVGVVVGTASALGGPSLRLMARGFVAAVRNTPPLVLVFILYFFVSSQLLPAMGVGSWVQGMGETPRAVIGLLFGEPSRLDAFVAGTFCLGLFEAAYVAEIVRAGIVSVPRGQGEAARSLGLARADELRFVVLPQALRNTLPPLASQLVSLVKDSSIVSLISIPELTFMASQTVNTTQRTFEVWITAGAIYFVLCFALTRLFVRFERR